MARPKKDIDPEQVRKLAAIDCSLAEIASVLKCSVDTLDRRFAEVIKKGREEGCASLKRRQFEVAQSGNPTMLIWLGKQRLGQSDKASVTHTGAEGGPIQTQDVPSTDAEKAERAHALLRRAEMRKRGAVA